MALENFVYQMERIVKQAREKNRTDIVLLLTPFIHGIRLFLKSNPDITGAGVELQKFSHFRVDSTTQNIYDQNGQAVHLTNNEFLLFELLYENGGSLISNERIMTVLQVNKRFLKNTVNRLNPKLEKIQLKLENEYNSGYYLTKIDT